MTSAAKQLANMLADWPLDREQRSLVQKATAEIEDDQAKALRDLLRDAELAMTSCASFLMSDIESKKIRDSHDSVGHAAKPQAIRSLDDLFLDTLKSIYFAKKKALTAFPKMARAVLSDTLRAVLENQELQAENQVERLEEIFELLDRRPQGKTDDVILGLLEEGQEIMKEYKGSPALDAGLIATAQAVAHYEISRYGTLKLWAAELGLEDAGDLLGETLREQREVDDTLSRIWEELTLGYKHAQSA
jgi:ferritin-like metal-binding protein YciE